MLFVFDYSTRLCYNKVEIINFFRILFTERKKAMYEAPIAEKLLFESPDLLNVGSLFMSAEDEGESETDNLTGIDSLLSDLL